MSAALLSFLDDSCLTLRSAGLYHLFSSCCCIYSCCFSTPSGCFGTGMPGRAPSFCSFVHLADARAEYPGKHTCVEHSAVMENGQRVWKAYETLFVDGSDFKEIEAAFEAVNTVLKTKLGGAELRIIKQRELVDFAIEWIEKRG